MVEEVTAFVEGLDPFNLFLNRVTDDIAPGYSEVIKTPMDISTIRTKKSTYTCAEEVARDVDLMLENSLNYNVPGDAVHNATIDLQIQWDGIKSSVLDGTFSIIKPPAPPKKRDNKVRREPSVSSTSRALAEDSKLLKIMREAWTYFRNVDEQAVFHAPFDPPGYREKIKQPIDLQTIESKLAFYTSFDELNNDLQLMLNNCILFNKGGWGEQYALKVSKIWGRKVSRFRQREVSILLDDEDDAEFSSMAYPRHLSSRPGRSNRRLWGEDEYQYELGDDIDDHIVDDDYYNDGEIDDSDDEGLQGDDIYPPKPPPIPPAPVANEVESEPIPKLLLKLKPTEPTAPGPTLKLNLKTKSIAIQNAKSTEPAKMKKVDDENAEGEENLFGDSDDEDEINSGIDESESAPGVQVIEVPDQNALSEEKNAESSIGNIDTKKKLDSTNDEQEDNTTLHGGMMVQTYSQDSHDKDSVVKSKQSNGATTIDTRRLENVTSVQSVKVKAPLLAQDDSEMRINSTSNDKDIVEAKILKQNLPPAPASATDGANEKEVVPAPETGPERDEPESTMKEAGFMEADGKLLWAAIMMRDPSVQKLLRMFLAKRLEQLSCRNYKLPFEDELFRFAYQLYQLGLPLRANCVGSKVTSEIVILLSSLLIFIFSTTKYKVLQFPLLSSLNYRLVLTCQEKTNYLCGEYFLLCYSSFSRQSLRHLPKSVPNHFTKPFLPPVYRKLVSTANTDKRGLCLEVSKARSCLLISSYPGQHLEHSNNLKH